jgi:hypothetical protein
LLHQRRRQLLPLPIGQGRFVDGIVTLAALQDLQKVQPTLAGRALEIGEQVVANHCAITVLAAMACPGVIGADVRRLRQSCRQHFALLLVKNLLVLGQDVVELAR